MKIMVTGANRGLGLSLTKVGLDHGHTIFASSRQVDEQVTKQLRELQKMYPDQLHIVQLDVTSEASVMQAVQEVKAITESLDGLINNAAILNEREKSIEELDIDAFKLALDINTVGPVRVVKHFLPLLKKGKEQSLINISSDSASLTNAYSGDYPYGMSKTALNMLTEKLHVTLKEDGFQVLSIHPGWMRTDMGGENAALNPIESAEGIFKIIHREKVIESAYAFVDHHGRPMEI